MISNTISYNNLQEEFKLSSYLSGFRKGYSRFIKIILLGGDLLFLNISFQLAYLLLVNPDFLFEFNDHYIFLHILFNLIWIISAYTLNINYVDRFSRIEKIIWNIFKSVFFHALLITCFIFLIKGFYYSRSQLLLTYLIFSFFIFSWRILFIWLLKVYRRTGANYRKVIVIGAGTAGNQIYNFLKSDLSHGYKFVGFFEDHPEKSLHKNLILGPESYVEEYIQKEKIDEIFCSLPLTSIRKIRELMNIADNNLVRFKMVPDFRGFLNKKVDLDFYNGVPVMSLRREPLENITNRISKRLFDIIISLFAILFLFPIIFPIVMLLIKISSRGPIFFKQKRNGKNNQEFFCYKFRTMEVNQEADKLQATSSDTRITKIGKILRRTNMDELPQFFNVLIGNMSVIGPRPHMLKHTVEYSRLIDKFMVRHLVKPGITGWAQVKGFRGATTESRMMMKRVRYDSWYIENWSLILDIQIIFLTIYNMIKGEENAV